MALEYHKNDKKKKIDDNNENQIYDSISCHGF